jgi:hypothetical protein
MFNRRGVSFCFQNRDNLSRKQLQFYDALQGRIERRGFSLLPDDRSTDTIEHRYRKIEDSCGVIIPAFCQWEGYRRNRNQQRRWMMPSEFAHIEATMAVAAVRPLLLLVEKGLGPRGVLKRGLIPGVIDMPSDLDPAWLNDEDFSQEFEKWARQATQYKDIFLGYSTQASAVGERLSKFLRGLNLAVYDWHDFHLSTTIWDSIHDAVQYTRCGLFLFMADDRLDSPHDVFAPRDNVVYEAGYFAGAQTRERTLIVREVGAKVPTDLGGVKYLLLDGRTSIGSIETVLRDNISRILDRL